MSFKQYAILLKIAGLAVFLVPLFMIGMGDIITMGFAEVITMIVIGAALLVVGNVFEAKAMRAGTRENASSDS